jgi:hypothetical protein
MVAKQAAKQQIVVFSRQESMGQIVHAGHPITAIAARLSSNSATRELA